MEPWRTAIVNSDETNLWIHGYDIAGLMKERTFADTIFLLHQGRLPTKPERRLLDAVLIGVADHGPGAPSCAAARIVASGNRQSLSAAIAAGVLAIGEEHGGAGPACIEMIADGVDRARHDLITLEESARRTVEQFRAEGRRLPGMGHRTHTRDPRTETLFGMARKYALARNGVAFMIVLESAAKEMIKPLPINIDGALGAILYDLGFPPALGQLIFIIGRVAGLTAEVAEEYTREKVMRVRIPVEYDGPPPRPVEPGNREDPEEFVPQLP